MVPPFHFQLWPNISPKNVNGGQFTEQLLLENYIPLLQFTELQLDSTPLLTIYVTSAYKKCATRCMQASVCILTDTLNEG